MILTVLVLIFMVKVQFLGDRHKKSQHIRVFNLHSVEGVSHVNTLLPVHVSHLPYLNPYEKRQ